MTSFWVFIVNFKELLHIFLVFPLLLTLKKAHASWERKKPFASKTTLPK